MKKASQASRGRAGCDAGPWSFSQPVRTARILEALQARRTWTASTLKVVLGRLVEKGFVGTDVAGPFYSVPGMCCKRSTASRPNKAYARRFDHQLCEKFGGRAGAGRRASQAELAELEDILRRAGGKQ